MIDFSEEINLLQNKLNENANDTKIMNDLAIAHLEMDEIVESYHYFKKAAELNPSVQTLTNLGFFCHTVGLPDGPYTYREANDLALEVLQKAISFEPKAHFPFTLLGELYLDLDRLDEAFIVLEKAVQIEETFETLNNIGVCYFQKGDYANARDYFLKAKALRNVNNRSLTPTLNYGICLAKLGDLIEAREVGEQIIKNYKDDFKVAEHEVADIYYELQDYEKVASIYSSTQYEFTKNWVSRYLYALHVTGQYDLLESFFNKVVKSVEKEINFIIEDEDDYWIPHERLEYIYALRNEISDYKQVLVDIQNGIRPELDFVPGIVTGCYLFGCKRHHIPNYSE